MSYHRSQYGNKSLSNKTLADSFYNDQLSCLISSPGWLLVTLVHGTQWHHQSKHWRSGPWKPCKVSAQKNFILKADTLSNLFSHSNWIKQQQNWKLTNLSVQELNTGSKKSSVWLPQSAQQWLLTGRPLQIPSEQDSAERSKNMKWVPV